MSGDLEEALRAALRPVDPGERFTRGVLARLPQEPPERAHGRDAPDVWPGWSWLPLTASVLLVLGAAGLWHAQRVREGEEARLQLLQALRVTGQKLDVAYRAVNAPALPGPSGT
jgi:hypothetical protein